MAKHSEPWQPEKFLQGDQATFPYQHETAVFYRAEPVSSFYGKNSILKKRYIEASNGFYTNGGEEGQGEELSAKSHGVFGGFLETAKFYARTGSPDPILRLEVPTSELAVVYVPPSEWDKRGQHEDPETVALTSLQELKDEFGTPEKMREVALKSLNDREGFGGYEFIMFMVPHEVPVDEDRNYVTGAWDTEFFQQPHFETLTEYVQSLKERHPKAMPDGLETDEAKEEVKRELQDLENISQQLGKMNDSIKANRNILQTDKASELPEKDRKFLRGTLERYQDGLNKTETIVEEEFDTETTGQRMQIESMVQINRKSLENVKNRIQEIQEEVEQIHEEEMEHGRRIIKEERDPDLFRKETRYEEKVEQRITEDLQGLPSFTPLIRKLQ